MNYVRTSLHPQMILFLMDLQTKCSEILISRG
jgi:hypothetical protein